jgi:hypothetical protein
VRFAEKTAKSILNMTATNKKKILFSCFLFFGLLFFAQFVNAEGEYMEGGATAGVKDLFSFISATVYWIAGGLAALILTTSALQWVINNQTAFVNFDKSGFVQHGLSVTQGLTDMLLLLIFVVSAFGIIFKYKDFEAKKTLPKIIAVAILTRFGPLLVKMMFDIGNVCINTIIANNNQLLENVMEKFFADIWYMIGTVIVAIAGAAALYAIPYLNLLALGATIVDILSTAGAIIGYDNILTAPGNATLYFATHFVIKWVFQIFASYILAGVFLSYIILFVSRIFMMQILAVVSPLAIMARALPQTEGLFYKWWRSLVDWTFVGVYTLFFLMLGLGSAGFIVPSDTGQNAFLKSGLGIDHYMLYYLFLIIYLSLVQSMANKEAAMGAMFRSTMLGAGMAAYTHVVKPGAEGIQRGAVASYVSAQSRIDAAKEAGEAPGIRDTIALHGSGVLAKAVDDKTMSGIRSIFSADESKINATAQGAAKTWNLSQLSNIEPLISAKVGEIGKDLTMDKALAKGKKLTELEAMAVLKQNIGKKEEAGNVQTILNNLGDDKKKLVLDSMLKNNLLTPSQIQTLAIGDKGLLTPKMIEKINSQDFNKKQAEKIKTLLGPDLVDSAYAENTARAIMLKGAAFNKDSLENLPSDIFDDQFNRLAFMANANTQSFGNLLKTRTNDFDKLAAHIQGMNTTDFARLAQTNPQLILGMIKNKQLKKYLPQYYKNADGSIKEEVIGRLIRQAPAAGAAPTAQGRAGTQPPPGAPSGPRGDRGYRI